jgi:hypothetical protein
MTITYKSVQVPLLSSSVPRFKLSSLCCNQQDLNLEEIQQEIEYCKALKIDVPQGSKVVYLDGYHPEDIPLPLTIHPIIDTVISHTIIIPAEEDPALDRTRRHSEPRTYFTIRKLPQYKIEEEFSVLHKKDVTAYRSLIFDNFDFLRGHKAFKKITFTYFEYYIPNRSYSYNTEYGTVILQPEQPHHFNFHTTIFLNPYFSELNLQNQNYPITYRYSVQHYNNSYKETVFFANVTNLCSEVFPIWRSKFDKHFPRGYKRTKQGLKTLKDFDVKFTLALKKQIYMRILKDKLYPYKDETVYTYEYIAPLPQPNYTL